MWYIQNVDVPHIPKKLVLKYSNLTKLGIVDNMI